MAAIEMNMTSKMTKALENMMTEAVRECVTYLAGEYSFDAEEALAKVSISCVTTKKTSRTKKEPKEKKAKFVKPAMPLPFCNAVIEGRCGGICLNNRLYTQCLKPAGENGLCAACNKQAAANEHGKPNYGLIYERIDNDEWTDPKGKAPVRYATVMLKQSIEKDAAVEEAAKFGWTIDEIQFEVEEKKPKKAAKRGRPAKTKGVETGGAGDDLIAQLVAQAQQEQGEEDETKADEEPEVVAEEPDVVAQEVEEEPKPVKKTTKKPKKTAEEKEAEKQAKLKAKEEEKAAKLAAKEAEKQAKLAAKEAAKEAKLQAKADAKAAKEAEKKALAEKKAAEKKAKEQVKEKVEVLEKELTEVATKAAEEIVQEMAALDVNDGELHEEEEEEEEEEEATEVVKFEVDGKTYLKDNEGVLYDMESQEAVGVWNEETKQIDEIDEDSDEEEDLE